MTISHAMQGLLRQLPPYNKPFPVDEKARWLKAFEAIIELDYPESRPPARLQAILVTAKPKAGDT